MSINVKILISAIILLSLINLVSATIEFDDTTGISLFMAKYDASAGTTTLYTTTQTNFDIFTDDLTAGDWIAWGYQYSVWHDLKLNVSTPLVADSINIVWQYSNSTNTTDATWVNLTVTDNTLNFTSLGRNEILFDVPDYFDLMKDIGTTSGDAFWIRAYVYAVTNPTEGGVIGLNSYTAKNYCITLRDSDYTPQDIYNADVSGGWGVVEHIGSYYWIKSNLRVGYEGARATNLTVTNSTILEIGYPVLGYDDRYRKRTLTIGTNSNLTIGTIDNSNNDTYGGSMLKYNFNYLRSKYAYQYNNWGGKLNLYNSIYYKLNGGFTDGSITYFDFVNPIFEGSFPYLQGSSTRRMKNAIISAGTSQTGTGYAYIYASNIATDNIIIGKTNGILTGATTTLTNINFGNNKNLSIANSNQNTTCLDCYMYNYTAQIPPMGTNNGVFFNTTLKIDIFNKTGSQIWDVSARIIDSKGNTVFDGLWTNQTVINTYHKKYVGSVYTINDYNPFTIILNSSGMVDYRTNVTINNLNKYLTITMGDYPFDINGTLVISQGKGIKVYK